MTAAYESRCLTCSLTLFCVSRVVDSKQRARVVKVAEGSKRDHLAKHPGHEVEMGLKEREKGE